MTKVLYGAAALSFILASQVLVLGVFFWPTLIAAIVSSYTDKNQRRAATKRDYAEWRAWYLTTPDHAMTRASSPGSSRTR